MEAKNSIPGLNIFLKGILKCAATLISCVVFTYIMGWMVFYFYLSQFGAEWLLPQIPPSSLMSKGIYPILWVFIYFWIQLRNYPEKEVGKKTEKKEWLENLKIIFLILMSVLIVYLFKVKIFDFLYGFFASLAAILLVWVLGGMHKKEFGFNHKSIFTLVVITLLMFVALPMSLGISSGKQDLYKNSNLPIIHLKDEKKKDNQSRLLLNISDKFYAINLGERNKVILLKFEQIDWIETK